MSRSQGKDERVEIAIHHWAPRFVAAGCELDRLTPPENAKRIVAKKRPEEMR